MINLSKEIKSPILIKGGNIHYSEWYDLVEILSFIKHLIVLNRDWIHGYF